MSSIGKALLVVAVIAGVSTTYGESLTLTLQQARERALKENPSLHASAEGVAAAVAQKGEAQAARLPTVSVDASYNRLSDVGAVVFGGIVVQPAIDNSYVTQATVNAPLFTGFRLENRERAADDLIKAARADVNASQSDIEKNVDAAYWQLYAARAALKTIGESIRLVQAHLADVKRMRNVGMATNDDVVEVQLRLSETRLREIQADHAAQTAQAALCNVLSLPLETQIAVADSPSVVARTVPPQDSLVRVAEDNRPDLRALNARRAAQGRQIAIAEGGHLPSVAFMAGYEYANPNLRYFPNAAKWQGTWNVGVGVSWTAWDWGLVSHQAQKARADAMQTDDRTRQLRDGIALQVLQARLGAVEAARRIEVADEGVSQAQDHYRNVKSRYSVGTASNTDVLDAEVALERARLDRLQAIVDQQLAWSRLQYAIGVRRG